MSRKRPLYKLYRCASFQNRMRTYLGRPASSTGVVAFNNDLYTSRSSDYLSASLSSLHCPLKVLVHGAIKHCETSLAHNSHLAPHSLEQALIVANEDNAA